MDMNFIPSPRSAPDGAEGADQFDAYHQVVSAVFADHRPVSGHGHTERQGRCSCGAAWPCGAERRAAQLLDWV